jgi:hypothetical protein
MALYDQILAVYPTLTPADFSPITGTIMLQDNSDGKGPYIAKWNHPTLAEPTQAQLIATGK